MKPRWDEHDLDGEDLLAQATFLVCVASFSAGVILVLAGAAAHEFRLMAAGALSLLLAGVTRSWLRSRGRFVESRANFDELETPADLPECARVVQLVRLLRQWEDLESQRGTPRFQPWALLEVRHEIRALVQTDPGLEDLFRDIRPAS